MSQTGQRISGLVAVLRELGRTAEYSAEAERIQRNLRRNHRQPADRVRTEIRRDADGNGRKRQMAIGLA